MGKNCEHFKRLEVAPLYERYDLREYGAIDSAGKAIIKGCSWLCHSKLDAKPQYFGVPPSMGKQHEWGI